MKVVKKLHWLFVKSFIGPFIGTFFISIFLLLMQTVWKYLEDLVGKGLELSVILEFLFYFAIHLIPMALPLAILLSSIMVFGNLAERYELVAIKSAGVSLLRAMRPMFVISILLAISAFYTANSLIPKANLSWGALLYDVTQKKPALNIVDNVFFKDIEGYSIRVGKKHDDNQTIEDIIIYVDDIRNAGNNNILIAKKGKMIISDDKQFMTLYLEDGRRYQELVKDPDYKKSMPHNTMEFSSYNLTIDLGELAFNRTDKERFSEDHRMMNITKLSSRIDSLDRYIAKKQNSLYKYLNPYFHSVKDTIVSSDTNIAARLKYLRAYNKVPDKEASSIKMDVSIDSSNSKAAGVKLIKPRTKPKRVSNRREILDKEDMLERAMQNVNNAKRISINNIDDTANQKELRAKYQVEWHRKFTLALSCILLFFIGAPLGAIIKKGGFGLPLVVSLLLFIVYYVISIFGEKMVKQGALPPFTGMWLSSFILFPLAIFLTYKASRDSQLFNPEAYKKLIPKRWRK
ncbi:MAG: LptF/LptG family permease [Bacteroidia bacterium]